MSLICGGRGPCCHVSYPHRHCEHCDVVIATTHCHHFGGWQPYWTPYYTSYGSNTLQAQLTSGLQSQGNSNALQSILGAS